MKYILTSILGVLLAAPVMAQEVGLYALTLEENRGFALGLTVLAGLLDGVNICGLTLIILFAGYLAVHIKDRKRSMRLGFVYLLTIFMLYVLAGVAFGSLVQSLEAWSGYQYVHRILNGVLVGVLVVAGALNIQDFFFSKKFIFEVGAESRKRFRALLRKVDYFGTVVAGCVSVLFLLPCSLPLYVASVGALSQVYGQAETSMYVFVYVLFFMLPLMITFSVILRTEKIISDKDIHSGKFKLLKLLKGGIQLGAAFLLYVLFF
jgi:cytochrome c biogenesis protein CcdA